MVSCCVAHATAGRWPALAGTRRCLWTGCSRTLRPPAPALVCAAAAPQDKVSAVPRLQSAALGLAAVAALALSAGPSSAEPRLPPLDTDPLRCERAYVGNTIGAPRRGLVALRRCRPRVPHALLHVLPPAVRAFLPVLSLAHSPPTLPERQRPRSSSRPAPLPAPPAPPAGQANAVSNKILDLRQCDFRGKNLSAKTLSGGLLSDSDLTGANLQVTASVGRWWWQGMCSAAQRSCAMHSSARRQVV